MNIEARRAVEALRSGVPNEAAVQLADKRLSAVSDRFLELQNKSNLLTYNGFIVGGDFGAGKSHALQYLKHLALKNNYVVSYVVISKETPLSELDLVFKNCMVNLSLPDRQSGDLSELSLQIDRNSKAYAGFYEHVMTSAGNFDPIFAATLVLFERLSAGDDLLDAIQSFWAGSKISISDLKRGLKNFKGVGIDVKTRKPSEIAGDRFRFIDAMISASKYRGWLIILDELELLATFSTLGRAKSYVNLSHLFNLRNAVVIAGGTRDLTGELINSKNDMTKITAMFSGRFPEMARQAIEGLRMLALDDGIWEYLSQPTADDILELHETIRRLYSEAYEWNRFPKNDLAFDPERSMRIYIRSWITVWDLMRDDPNHKPSLQVETLTRDLSERGDAEQVEIEE